MKKTIIGILTVLMLVILALLGYMFFNLYQEQKVDEEYKLLVMQSKDISDMPLTKTEFEYLQTRDYISESVLRALGYLVKYDEQERIISIVNYHNFILYDLNNSTIYINGKQLELKNQPINIDKISNKEFYFSLSDFDGLLDVGYYINNKRKIIMALDNSHDYFKANVKSKTPIFSMPNPTEVSEKIMDIKRHKNVFIGKSVGNWTEVISDKLIHGYIKKADIAEELSYKTTIPQKPKFVYSDKKINMTWEAVYSYNPNTNDIGEMKGLNVISPTWLSLYNSDGDISRVNVSHDYISWAKSRNYEVWPLVSNSFKPQMTKEFLNSAKARKNFIDKILSISLEYDFDGVNIDFENVFLESKEDLTHFVAELSQVLRQNGITVSMDVTVMGGSDNWSRCYDRETLGKYVDYLIVMAYDQHWASSPISGSVASYDWMASNMNKISKIVPKHKLILGMPLYMREWKEVPSTTQAGVMDTKSSVMSMPRLRKINEEKKFNYLWDDRSKQYYIAYIEDNVIHKIWVENKNSIAERVKFAKQNDLAGVATWRRGFETPEIWGVIDKNLNRD